jgi:hypothetical protein
LAVGSQEGSVTTNFGLLIGYVLPGFTVMQGLPILSGSQLVCAAATNEVSPTLPGLLSGTVQAIAVGLTVSTLRWLIIDTFHHHTGLRPPRWDFALLEKSVAAFELLVHVHYRYYKFYANMVVALMWAFIAQGAWHGTRGLVYWLLAALFLFASRDALRKYYERAGRLLVADGG